MNKSSSALLSAVFVASLLSGCAKDDLGSSGVKKDVDKTTNATADQFSTSTTTSTASGTTATSSGTSTDTSNPSTVSTVASNPSASQNPTTAAAAAAGMPKQIKVNINKLPDDLVICNIDGNPIKVGEYRNMLKLQQTQMQATIAADPNLRQSLLIEARKRGITLTPEEHSKLLDAAKAQHKDMAAFLKEKNITQAQFDKEVEDAGLTFKMSNVMIEEGMLSQLVSRELLSKASINAGLKNDAIGRFAKLNKSHNFADLKAQTGLSQDALKDELIKGELAKMQVDRLEKSIKVSDAEIKQYYAKHKNELLHGERVRLSSILVLAPQKDVGPFSSVESQVKQANPKLTGKDLDATVAQVNMQLQNKALILLGEAKATSSNFAKLANENDPIAQQTKSGGDMGWQEKKQLVPQFVDAIWDLKPGTVLPKIVKTDEGYRIIKVTGHETSGPVALADIHNAIAAKLRQDKLQQVVNAWINQQQTKTKIEFSQGFVALANGSAKNN